MRETGTVDPSYLRKERNNYSVWPFAFWREFYQNSIDAGANLIRAFRTLKSEDGQMTPGGMPQHGTLITFGDNGRGMNAHIIRNVFFRLGCTTKTVGIDIGGAGRARLLTCFSNHSYGIRTQDCLVVGEGLQYDLTEGLPYHQGCEFWVDVNTKGNYGEEDLDSALRNYLSYSQMDCDIESNIEGVDNFNNWLYKRRHARDLSVGGVYVNKSGDKRGELIVRVKGVPMFVKGHRADAQVVVELTPEHSLEYLVNNRDSLHYRYERELDEFLQEIAIDRHSALREFYPMEEVIGKTNDRIITFRKGIENRIDNKDRSDEVDNGPQILSSKAAGPVTFSNDAAGTSSLSPNATMPPKLRVVSDERLNPGDNQMAAPELTEAVDTTNDGETTPDIFKDLGYENTEENEDDDRWDDGDEEQPFDENLASLVLYCESNDAAMKKAMWLFNPNNKDGKYFGSKKKKLALLWSVAVEAAIEAFLEEREQDSVAWKCGFLFSTENPAQHRESDGVHQILLRPVSLTGSIDYHLSSVDDRVRLMVYACHEVTHMAVGYHDEDFTTFNDRLHIRVYSRQKEILKRMSRSIAHVGKRRKQVV